MIWNNENGVKFHSLSMGYFLVFQFLVGSGSGSKAKTVHHAFGPFLLKISLLKSEEWHREKEILFAIEIFKVSLSKYIEYDFKIIHDTFQLQISITLAIPPLLYFPFF